MSKLVHKYKGYYIRLVKDGIFQLIEPNGYATYQFFHTLI